MPKKSFINKDNPVMNFISQTSIDKAEGTAPPTGTKTAPAGYKPNPAYIETKSRRVQLLIQPSLYEEAKAVSEKLGVSLNEFITRAVYEATHNEATLERIRREIVPTD